MYIHDHLINAIGSQKLSMSVPPWSFCRFRYHWP